MNDLFSIKEFSKITGVETSTLRYWDEIGLFSPLKRDPDNNYRYYSLVQIIALHFVTVLTDLDIPLRTVADLRHDRDPEKFLKLMDKQEKMMDMEMQELRHRYSIIHARRELINYGMKVDDRQIDVMKREDKHMILWPKNEYSEGETFIHPLASFIKSKENFNVNLSFPVGGYHESFETFKAGPGKPDNFISIDPVGNHLRKEGEYLIGFARGFYGDLGDLPERMQAYAAENNLKITGPVYTMYLHDEVCVKDTTQFLAQACVAVSRKKIESRSKDGIKKSVYKDNLF